MKKMQAGVLPNVCFSLNDLQETVIIPRSDSLPEIFKKYVIDNEAQRRRFLILR